MDSGGGLSSPCPEMHRMHKYIIMGVQGCGKGTQARLLQQDLDLVHISVGDIFRWHIQNHTKLGARCGLKVVHLHRDMIDNPDYIG